MTELIIWIVCAILIGILIGSAAETGRDKWILDTDRKPRNIMSVLVFTDHGYFTGQYKDNAWYIKSARGNPTFVLAREFQYTVLKWQPIQISK